MKTLNEILIAEATEHDFKLMLEEKNPISWLKSVSAFANGFGGSLYFGVDDSGTVVGLSDTQYTADKISEFIVARIEPPPLYTLEPMLVEDREVLRLVVKSGMNTPYYFKSGDNRTAYYRSGNESVKATDHILTELILKGSRRTFDVLDSDYFLSDHSFTLLNSAYKKNTGNLLVIPDDLISFGLLSNEDHLTYAGALFADYCPVYNSRVFCTRWSGLDKGRGMIDATDDQEYSANVLMLVKNGVDFMRKHNHVMWHKPVMTRIEMPDYPLEAMTEALTNAIIHRDYSVIGSEVHIDIYDNRIEITSPGGMYGNKPIQDLRLGNIPSRRRNPVIADLFQRLDYAERRGSGIRKILNGYRNSDRQPEFYSNESWFTTTLYNLNYGLSLESIVDISVNGFKTGADNGADGIKHGTDGTVNSVIDSENVPENVPENDSENDSESVLQNKRYERQSKILELLKEDGAITRARLSLALNVSEKTIQRDIEVLKAQKRIERVGSDTSGYWKVIDKVGETDE